ncbi:hypothetical protein Tco_1419144 [Tanacetum coccineum]
MIVPSNQTPTLLSVPVSVILESSHVFTAIPKSLPSLTPPPLLTTPTPLLTIETTNPLSTIPDFASVFQFNDRITALEKEVAELKNDPLYTQNQRAVKRSAATALCLRKWSYFASTYDLKLLFKESRDEVTLAKGRSRQDKDKDEDPSAGSNRGLKRKKTSKDAETTIGLKNKIQVLDLYKSSKLMPMGNFHIVPVDYFINNDIKYLQGGVLTMTYTTSTTKTKAAQYDLPRIEDMVPNIWSPVKVAYDKHALWGISHWREQRKNFYGYARGLQLRQDVYSTKRILAVHSDSKEGDDVADFAIALRMFTRSLIIQKRVEDLQLRVESNQKKINVTKPDTKRPDIRLMRSDELYKFSDGTLTRLLSSLEDITKNIDLEYLPRENIRVILFTVKMEVLLEPTSNKLMVDVLERFYTSAGNPVNEILLKLNLPDHRSILTDSKVTLTKHGQMTKPYSSPRFIANCVNAKYLKMEVKVPDSS